MPLINCAGMRTEINKKRGTPSKRSEEARAKGAKRGKNNWVVGRGGTVSPLPPPPKTGSRCIFEVYNYQKRNLLAGNAGHSRQIDIEFYGCVKSFYNAV